MILAHIAGVPVEETLLSAGPALVAAFSVGLVHIRSRRDRPAFGDDERVSADAGGAAPAEGGLADDEPVSADAGGAAPEGGQHPDDPVDSLATAEVGAPGPSGRADED